MAWGFQNLLPTREFEIDPRTAVDNDGLLGKESTSYNDMFDAFRLALKFYHFKDSNEY